MCASSSKAMGIEFQIGTTWNSYSIRASSSRAGCIESLFEINENSNGMWAIWTFTDLKRKKNPSQDRESKGQGTMRQNGTRGQQQQDTLAVATASAAICTVAESLPMPEIMVSDLPAASRCTYDDDSKQDP
jgi:hypothetical protein